MKHAAILGAAAVAAPPTAAATPSPVAPDRHAPLTPHPGALADVARDEAYWATVAVLLARITTYPPLAPGTAPLISSRQFSLSIRTSL